jgi:hypothetical protein
VKNTPFAMVSYAWGVKGKSSDKDLQMASAARALAAALPNCWSDVHMMSSGSVVPAVTSLVARTAHLLVLILTPSYLRSRNCSIELVAALLHRRAHHVTWAYVSQDVPQPICSFLTQSLGVTLYTSMAELLRDADESVYRTPPTSLARVTQWFSVYSEARESVSRNFRLPPPRVRDGRCMSCRGRLLLPRGSVTAGRFYLAPDASSHGESVVVVMEQVLLAVVVVSIVTTFLLLRAGYIANAPIGDTLPQDVPLSIWLPLPLVVALLLSVVVVCVLPFALLVDVRTHHSSLLLPLCAAAYIQTYEGVVPRQGKGRWGSRSGGGSSGGSSSSGGGDSSGAIRFLFAVGDEPRTPATPGQSAPCDKLLQKL